MFREYTATMEAILDPSALIELPEARLFDARPGDAGRAAFAKSHLHGAIHVDLATDLSAPAPTPEVGGRHPLPSPESFCAWLGACGVTPETHVVVYDDLGGANAAARMWWMLRALGHARVQVVDGGLRAAVQAGVPRNYQSEPVTAAPPYPATRFEAPQVEHAQVDLARRDPERCVIDVRAADRFQGKREHLDPIAGHIPGAVNLPFARNLDASGRFKPALQLRTQYEEILAGRPSDSLIVHCGSGVTACHTLLALDRAGLSGAALYVGSWSEWCRNDWPREP